jgi:putative AlgH/UPF0301 family transcriptional regulator
MQRLLLILAALLSTNAWIHPYPRFCGQKGRRTALTSNTRLRCSAEDFVPTEITPATELAKGVVLLSQPNEFNHFLIKAAVLVFDFGSERGSRGVILERATAFSMGETTPNAGVFEGNTLFMGGSDGSDTAMMFHKYDLDGTSKYIGAGLFLGGLKGARELVESRIARPKDFKFIFNTVEWPPGLLETEFQAGRWDLVKVPPELVLEQGKGIGTLWSRSRQTLRIKGAALQTKLSEAEDADVKEAEAWDMSGQPIQENDGDENDEDDEDDEITDGYGSMQLQ